MFIAAIGCGLPVCAARNVRRFCGGCVAVGRRPAARRRGLIARAARKRIGGARAARRRRDQAEARLEDLLALSRRFRRAAGVRFRRIRKRQIRDGAVAGADAFSDGAGGHSIGYKDDVILPLHVVPRDAGKPVTLRLKLDYAVCEKLCVPAEAKLELQLDRHRRARRTRLSVAAEARVPKAAPIGGGGVACRSARCIAMPASGKPTRHRRCGGSRPARRSTCLPRARPPMGAAAAGAGRRRARADCSASRSTSTACRPARSANGATLELTAVAGGTGDRGRIPARLIRRSALI